ncbi:MAG: NADH-quinone oxidoreductase subunit N [Deltaproteobacteria bacterium]|nr:NADH-quinone oxidoreductase subunit N [Deltaproteobacteria bacterium]MBI3078782.1 NADH-quinone oxidoreductase subunit N [Deltaproteobacteria bacterium]
MPDPNWSQALRTVAPELTLTIVALIVLVLDLVAGRGRKGALAAIAVVGTLLALGWSVSLWGERLVAYGGMVVADNYSLFFNIAFLAITVLTILLSTSYLRREEADLSEYYVLLLFCTLGMMLMAKGLDLIVIFLGLEILSISNYVLAGFLRTRLQSNESALKYFLLGSFSSAFFLYGIALIYGTTGSTNLGRIAQALQANRDPGPLFQVGMALLLVGFAFKVASVPFHMWTPDAYEGAPTPITAYMSVGPKAAAFAAFLRVFSQPLAAMQGEWAVVLWVLAALTMTVGNVVAIAQPNIKRMLAYSSIAHAGYLLVPMVASGELGTSSLLFYVLAYAFTTLGAFAVVILLSRKGEAGYEIAGYAGLGYTHPVLALAMTLFMLSLGGIPPTAGFVAKFYIFSAAVKAGYIWLTVIGVLTSAVSLYYYLRIVVLMYMREPAEESSAATLTAGPLVTLAIAAFAVLLMGLFPGSIFTLAQSSVFGL